MFIGSKEVENSTNKKQLVYYKGEHDEFTSPAPLKSLSFTPKSDCTVSINEKEAIMIPANATLEIDQGEIKIESFVINEGGVEYFWIALI